jgi:hypothetical protein
MVVAGVALLVALGGTSIAAVTGLPPGSVNTAALQNGAVTTRKLANNAVTLGKLAPGARIPGPKGDKGDKGDVGPSDGYERSVASFAIPASGALALVNTLTIPQAGSYLIWAKAWFLPPSASQTSIECKLGTGGNTDTSDITIGPLITPQTMALNVANQYSGAGFATLVCTSIPGGAIAENAVISAIRVANLTASSG